MTSFATYRRAHGEFAAGNPHHPFGRFAGRRIFVRVSWLKLLWVRERDCFAQNKYDAKRYAFSGTICHFYFSLLLGLATIIAPKDELQCLPLSVSRKVGAIKNNKRPL